MMKYILKLKRICFYCAVKTPIAVIIVLISMFSLMYIITTETNIGKYNNIDGKLIINENSNVLILVKFNNQYLNQNAKKAFWFKCDQSNRYLCKLKTVEHKEHFDFYYFKPNIKDVYTEFGINDNIDKNVFLKEIEEKELKICLNILEKNISFIDKLIGDFIDE